MTFCLWSLVCDPLPGWKGWILTAILFLDSSALSLRPRPWEGLGGEIKIREFLLHSWGFPSKTWAWIVHATTSKHLNLLCLNSSLCSVRPVTPFVGTLTRIRARSHHFRTTACLCIVRSTCSNNHFSMATVDKDCRQEWRRKHPLCRLRS